MLTSVQDNPPRDVKKNMGVRDFQTRREFRPYCESPQLKFFRTNDTNKNTASCF